MILLRSKNCKKFYTLQTSFYITVNMMTAYNDAISYL